MTGVHAVTLHWLRSVRTMQVLLTTRTADFFEQRDFLHAGVAHESDLIPESRRALIDPARNSKLYVKALYDLDDAAPRAGKRLGF